MPRRFYIWSAEGDGACLAWRLKGEGEDVVLRIDDKAMRPSLEGVVEHTRSRPRRSDIVVFDSVGNGAVADDLAGEGFAVIGAAEACDRLELDRSYAMAVAREVGVQVPESQTFTDYGAAQQFIAARGGRWVYKPSGNLDTAFTYVAEDEADMIRMLVHFERVARGEEFILQRYVEGVLISTEGWFSGEDWIEGSWNSTFEEKALMNGGIGPSTGCMGNVVWSYAAQPRIAHEVHLRLSSFLHDVGYVGAIDANCAAANDGLYVLEFTPRFGYDAIQAYVGLFNEPLADVLEALAHGNLDRMPVSPGAVALGVRFAVPPYPFADVNHKPAGDIPIVIKYEDTNNVWLNGVQRNRYGFHVAPTDGFVGVVTSVASDISTARSEAYARLERIRLADMMYRTDIGERFIRDSGRLATLGYETFFGAPSLLQVDTDHMVPQNIVPQPAIE
jgi:phosphoribosylamine--glycine ligase